MKNKEILACLEHVPIFDSLNDDEMSKLVKVARHDKYSKNEFIYQSGESLDALYVVHEGSVKILKYTMDGREQVIRVLKHGDFFGEKALFGPREVSNFAEILEDAVICKIEQRSFANIIIETPTIASKMLLELSLRLDNLEETITFNNLKNSEAKLAKYLLDHHNKNIVNLTVTKKTISGMLGITPETFSRKLKEFEEIEVVHIISNKQIKLLNTAYLEELTM